jgi:hypothetical protein
MVGGGASGSTSSPTVEPLWSLDLDLRGGLGVQLDQRGRLLVSRNSTLTSFMPDGQLNWEVTTLGETAGPIAVLPDGGLIRGEGDHLVTRDADSGAVVRSFPAPRARAVIADPWGGLVYVEANPGSAAVLHCTTETGTPRWTIVEEEPSLIPPPVAMADSIVLAYDHSVRIVDQAGKVRWLVAHDGFHDPQAWMPPASEEIDSVWLRPIPVGPITMLVGLSWYTSHKRLFLADTAARTVQPYADWMVPTNPLAVLPWPDGGFRVALPGPRYEVRQMEWEWSVVMLDRAGNRLWEHLLHTEPTAVTPGPAGTLIVASRPERRRWDLYHEWQDMSKDNYVRCLDADGTERWTWYAPDWLHLLPKVSPDGMVYAGSAGRVWALPLGSPRPGVTRP